MDMKQPPESLPTWVTPRLMRLNQADGTNKHLDVTEDVYASNALNRYNCTAYSPGIGGAVAAGAVCGPS